MRPRPARRRSGRNRLHDTMNTLQSLFESVLKKELSLAKLGVRIIAERFKELNIELTASQRAAVEAKLSAVQGNDVTLAVEITDAQLVKSTTTPEQWAAGTISLDLDPNTFLARFEELLPEIIPPCVEEMSRLALKHLKRQAPRMLKDRRARRRGFETRLARTWDRGLDFLEMFREIALEAGNDFNGEFRPEAAVTKDFVFEVLTRLHARACQVASEVLALLRAGHADGAHARWRLLHEIAVVGLFVQRHGHEVAERYILHDAVESGKAARLYQEHYAALGVEPLSEEKLAQIQSILEALKNRFGPDYGNDYGWASAALGKRQPTFRDIEQAAELDHLRPYYKLASHNVHANPKGTFFKLGLLPDQNLLLAGPSDLGLADPGHGTAISLGQITIALLTLRPNIDRLVICQILLQLEDEIGDAFLAVHRGTLKEQ